MLKPTASQYGIKQYFLLQKKVHFLQKKIIQRFQVLDFLFHLSVPLKHLHRTSNKSQNLTLPVQSSNARNEDR